MALPHTETFTAGNGTNVNSISGWHGAGSGSNSNGLVVQNNGAQANSNMLTTGNWWITDAFDANHYCKATVVSVANGAYVGVGARMSGTNGGSNVTGMFFYSAPDDGCYFDLYVNGSFVDTLAGPGTAFAVNDEIEIRANGTSFVGLVNGATRLSITEGTLSSGAAGICAYHSGASRIDNVELGNLSAPPAADKLSRILRPRRMIVPVRQLRI